MQSNINKNETNLEKETSDLSGYIEELINKNVYVKLNEDSEYIGKLICFDSSFNLVLEDCNQIKNNSNDINSTNIIKKHKETFIRGNNVSYICLQ